MDLFPYPIDQTAVEYRGFGVTFGRTEPIREKYETIPVFFFFFSNNAQDLFDVNDKWIQQ